MYKARQHRAAVPSENSKSRRTLLLMRRICRQEEGVTTIEFGMLAPIFLFLLFSILDMGLFQLASRSLDLASDTLTRKVRTGQFIGKTAAEFKEELCSELIAFVNCEKVAFKVEKLDSFKDSANVNAIPTNTDKNVLRQYQDTVGREIVLVRLVYVRKSFLPQFSFVGAPTVSTSKVIQSATIFRNEPF